MANHKSAAKRARQAVKKNARNSQALGTVRTFERKLRTAIAGNDSATAKTLFSDYMSKMSKAAQGGVVHAKTASRKISRLAQSIDEIGKTAKA